MNRLVILILTAALLFCCASAKQQEVNVQGHWQWVKSVFITRGMKGPKVSNPQSRGYSIELKIGEKEIEIFKNEKSVATVPYLLYKQAGDLEVMRVSIPQDDFPFFISSGPIYQEGDTLIIAGAYNDAGEDQYYVPIK